MTALTQIQCVPINLRESVGCEAQRRVTGNAVAVDAGLWLARGPTTHGYETTREAARAAFAKAGGGITHARQVVIRPWLGGHRMQFDQLRRRAFITLLGGAAAVWPLAARAQQTDRMRRIGVLVGIAESDREGQARVAAFRQGLHELKWVEGHNVRIEIRWGAGDAARTSTSSQ